MGWGWGRKALDWEKGWGYGERLEACSRSCAGGNEVGGAKEGPKGGGWEPWRGQRGSVPLPLKLLLANFCQRNRLQAGLWGKEGHLLWVPDP